MTFEERAKELVGKMTLEEKISQLRYDAPSIERLNIPAYNWWNESLHGVAKGPTTVFPQSIAMAASFDEKLIFEVAEAISTEVRAKYNAFRKLGDTEIYEGITCWAPNINIFRDPRWGRGHETYGEDPYLTAKMGTAYIKGMQGEGKYRKTDTTLKHFAVHSGPEALRHEFDAKVSEKDLRETYLSAFKYCIENADPSAVMGAYNAVNGEACCASQKLLADILRDEWGFKGYVVSDCGAVCDINEHHKLTESVAESAAGALNTGCDLNCGTAYRSLDEAYKLGLVSEETITKSVERLFTARFRLGMFDDDCEYDNIPYDVIECPKHRELNRKMAQESIVLLKNNGILPLDKNKKIAVIGPNANSEKALLGNYNGIPSRYTTILKGILDECENTSYTIGSNLFKENTPRENKARDALAVAQNADIIILCMGLDSSMEGEESDTVNSFLNGDKCDLELPKAQRTLIESMVSQNKPVIFVNVSGSAINLSYEKEHCDAVLQCFYPGAEGGKALADIIFGKVSPSGRLPVTFYKSVEDLPPFEDYSMENRTYKFFKGEVVYPFGYGLTYSKINEIWIDENTVSLTNEGDFDTGYTVLKFEYIPHKSLCGFKRVFLSAGETITVKF